MIKRTEDTRPRENLGYFEEIFDINKNKLLGIIIHKDLPEGRGTCSENSIKKTLNGKYFLQKGHKKIQYNFKNTEVSSIIYPLQGRVIK